MNIVRPTASQQSAIDPILSDAPELGFDLRAFGRLLWRRRYVIINTVALLCIATLIILFQLRPVYSASTLMAIESRKNNIVNMDAVLTGLGTDVAAITTEVDVLRSRRLVGKLVDKLDLTKDPEFNFELREEDPLNPVNWVPEKWKRMLLGDEQTLSAEAAAAQDYNLVVNNVIEALSVHNPARSYSIAVTVKSHNPEKAALLANTLAELYLTDQLEYKYEATSRASNWLNERISTLREKVRVSELAVQRFREDNQLFQTHGQGLVNEQQLSEVNSSLITARTELARAEARFQQLDKLARNSIASEETLAEVLTSPLIQSLKQQESEVLRRRAELATRYGPKHPNMIKVEAELADLQTKVRLEMRKIVSSLEGEVRIAQAKVRTLEDSLNGLKSENVEANRAFVQLREMEREAEASRVLLETFLTRFRETSNQEDLQQADARILSVATAPTEASFPRKGLTLLVVFFGSIATGIGIAFLLETLENGYHTLEQLTDDVNIKGLGLIPHLFGRNQSQPEQYILDKSTSSFAEAHRNVFATLMFSQDRSLAPKVIQVTSSVSGEGKSTFALCLARLLAKSGSKILLIEADLRRPTLQRRVPEIAGSPTLLDCLQQNLSIKDAIARDEKSGCYFIAGGHTPEPQRYLVDEKLQQFITAARQTFDLIIIDTPPVLAVSDVILTSKLVDKTVYVVHWDKTAKESVRTGLSQLSDTGVDVAGAVISQVNVKKHVGYGYGEYGHYYGKHKAYYTN
ncbi:GumC family protein [Pseudokordiimonas caeni]|uniref:GumC family protein n=1 Tax=Pseudokordiimonas caeni TaxID=2997908 RepID=UPI0028120DC3|nr:polysaccharide biosynthesis tyrosine autokinase [Pseudokordiimonas caeni]